ncbi:MAG: ABC-type dipeptide/oligopeptide/nickel transport system permease subunit [Bacteriovoracaceae bacterium]
MEEAVEIHQEEIEPSILKEFWSDFSKNRGAVLGLLIIVLFILIAFFAPLLAPHAPTELFGDALRAGPVWSDNGKAGFFFGTDDVGRDILSRLIYGARVSMSVGFMVVFVAMLIGVNLGLMAGYFGGWLDRIIMRCTDILMSLPSILLAIVVVAILGPGLQNTVLAVAVVAVPSFIRIVRASVIAEKNKQYVMASQTFGAGPFRIMYLEILPNCLAPLIVQGTLGFSDGILNAAALGFLGLGAQPPTPEWGTMLSDARAFIESSPWMVTLPGLCILFSVLGFNLFGDGLRDALDPRLKK